MIKYVSEKAENSPGKEDAVPELPEVENVKRKLAPRLAGRTILSAVVHKPVVAYPAEERFLAAVQGREIADTRRRGKFLILLFKDGGEIVVHLRMTGRLTVDVPQQPPQPHTHIVFYLSDGNELRFADARRFGRVWLIEKGEKDVYTGMEKLGLEPFDERLTPACLEGAFARRRIAVKQALLEQTVVAGIGNIYADETLYDAKIRPDRSVSSLSREEWQRIVESMRRVLAAAVIKRNASAGPEYREEAKAYGAPFRLRAYGHENRPCGRCGEPIGRVRIGGRSSFFCPNCQRES